MLVQTLLNSPVPKHNNFFVFRATNKTEAFAKPRPKNGLSPLRVLSLRTLRATPTLKGFGVKNNSFGGSMSLLVFVVLPQLMQELQPMLSPHLTVWEVLQPELLSPP